MRKVSIESIRSKFRDGEIKNYTVVLHNGTLINPCDGPDLGENPIFRYLDGASTIEVGNLEEDGDYISPSWNEILEDLDKKRPIYHIILMDSVEDWLEFVEI
jgi:hypothetical protein